MDAGFLADLAETVVIWGANFLARSLPPSPGRLVWDKKTMDQFYGKTTFSDCEIAWVSNINKCLIFPHIWNGIVRQGEEAARAGYGRVHPTQKPVRLMAWCMETVKVPSGGVVLDPFMGSGTTGVAALRTGRRFVGIEKDPTHYATALARITNELAQGDLFLGHNSDYPDHLSR